MKPAREYKMIKAEIQRPKSRGQSLEAKDQRLKARAKVTILRLVLSILIEFQE